MLQEHRTGLQRPFVIWATPNVVVCLAGRTARYAARIKPQIVSTQALAYPTVFLQGNPMFHFQQDPFESLAALPAEAAISFSNVSGHETVPCLPRVRLRVRLIPRLHGEKREHAELDPTNRDFRRRRLTR